MTKFTGELLANCVYPGNKPESYYEDLCRRMEKEFLDDDNEISDEEFIDLCAKECRSGYIGQLLGLT